MEYHPDASVFKSIRSVFYSNGIIMDCTFAFDTSKVFANKELICDVNNACIFPSGLDEPSFTRLHFENLGVGNLQIVEIKRFNQRSPKRNTVLFDDDLLCIGDSEDCEYERFVDLISK